MDRYTRFVALAWRVVDSDAADRALQLCSGGTLFGSQWKPMLDKNGLRVFVSGPEDQTLYATSPAESDVLIVGELHKKIFDDGCGGGRACIDENEAAEIIRS